MGVADAVQRRDHVVREPARLFEDGRHQVGPEIAVKPLLDRAVEARDVAHRERDVGNRRAIGHVHPPEARIRFVVDAHRRAFKPAPTSADPDVGMRIV